MARAHVRALTMLGGMSLLIASFVPAIHFLGGAPSLLGRMPRLDRWQNVGAGKADSDPRLRRTAIVTLVQGEVHARMAIALLQSLRDVGTRIPRILVLVGRGNMGSAECEALVAGGQRRKGWCQREGAPISDQLSAFYIRALLNLGASLRPLVPVPRSKYVAPLEGGLHSGWGAAFNKLQVLLLVEFRRVVWMDCDTIALRNLDHLLLQEPLLSDPTAFMAAATVGCCDLNAFGKMGGSLWAFAPSRALYEVVLNKSFEPCPLYEDGKWMQGDQSVVAHAIGSPFSKAFHVANIRGWPWIDDMTQGVIPGVTLLPHYRNVGEDHLAVMRAGVAAPKLTAHLAWSLPMRFPASVFGDGFVEAHWTYTEGRLPPALLPPPASQLGPMNTGVYHWEPLDARYDIMVGSCECVPQHDLEGREQDDSIGEQFTAHFSCFFEPLLKPASYPSEQAFLTAIYADAHSCHRKYYLRWYDMYTRALSGPSVPVLRGGVGEAAGEPPRAGPVPWGEGTF